MEHVHTNYVDEEAGGYKDFIVIDEKNEGLRFTRHNSA